MGEQKRQFWIILVIVFLGFLGTSMPYLIFPALFLNPDYAIFSSGGSSHGLLLGITLAAYPLGQFIGSPILGAMSDDFGRKKILTTSLVAAAFFNLLSGFAIEWSQLLLLIVSRFAAGCMEGNIAIARAMAADLKTLSKHETFGKINASSSIAYLLGPLVGGLLTKGGKAATPFYIITALFLVLALLTTLALQNTLATNEPRGFWQRMNFMGRLKNLFAHRNLKFLLLVSTLFTLAVDIFYEFAPVHLTVEWKLAPINLVSYNSLLCLGLALGNGWLAKFFSTRLSHSRAILGGMGAFALLMLGIVLSPFPHLTLTLFGLCGLVIGVAVTFLTVKISDSVSDTVQGEVLGVQLSLRVLGDAFICLFGGALLLISSKLILIAAAILTVATMAYGRWLKS